MGLAIMLLYVSLSLLSPADMIPALTPYRVLLLLAGLALLASIPVFLVSGVTSWNPHQFWLMVLFVGWVVCSWIPHRWLGGVWLVIRDFFPAVIIYFLAVLHLGGPKRLALTRFVLVATVLYILAMGFHNYSIARVTNEPVPYVLVQVFESGPLLRLQGLGTLADPNIFGQLLLALLPMLFVSSRPGGMRIGYLFAIPVALLFLFGIFLTGSRGAYLGLVVLLGLTFRQRFPVLGTWVAAVMGIGLIASLRLGGGRSISMSGGMDRLSLWSDGMGLFKHSPLWGIGYKGFSDNVGMTAHNTFLLCAAELGIIGFFLWMAVVVVTFYGLGQVSKLAYLFPGAPSEYVVLSRWAKALKISLSVYLFTGFFLSDTYEMPLYLLIGMSGALYYAAVVRVGNDKLPLPRKWPGLSFVLCISTLALVYVMLRLRAV